MSSFVVYHYPQLPDTAYPYCVALISLEEGVRVVAPILPNDGAGLGIGAAVELGWTDGGDGGSWPVFTKKATV